MASYKVEHIKNINEFFNVVENIKRNSEENGNYAELLFRGQSRDKPLLPKLGRLRLIDWTYSSLVALWFAVCEASKKDNKGNNENAVVWILNAEVEDFRTDTQTLGPLSNKITKIYKPKVVSRRISAQAGAFTVHKINEGGKIIKFELHKRYGKKLTKVVIPHSEFKTLRKNLNILGINNSTVFPDLDGFCKHLERRFSKLDDE